MKNQLAKLTYASPAGIDILQNIHGNSTPPRASGGQPRLAVARACPDDDDGGGGAIDYQQQRRWQPQPRPRRRQRQSCHGGPPAADSQGGAECQAAEPQEGSPGCLR